MNPRFIAYTKAHGRTPKQQLAHNAREYPGGKMAGFICWINERVRAFKKAHPEAMCGDNIHDQDAFTAYLSTP